MPEETSVLDRPMPQVEPKEKRDFRQEVTDSIVAMLEKGTAPWQKPWDAEKAFDLPFNPDSSKAYRGGNALHLMAVGMKKGYADPRWMTYKQAAENGWQVRKGEKGTHIEFWQFRDEQGKDSKGDDRTSEQNESGRRAPLHRVYTVFNAEQIDGIPPHQRKATQEWEVVAAGEKILQHSGAEIAHDQRDRAFYSRATDAIHLPPQRAFASPADYYGTALHELAHWSGHPARLNRPTLNESYRFGDPNYAKEELRAELTSVFLAAEKGIPHNPEKHAAYVGSWIKALSEDKNEIFRAAKDAHQAADFLVALEKERSVEKAVEATKRPAGVPEEPQLRRETSEHVAAFEPGSSTVNLVEKETATEHRAVASNGRPRTADRQANAGLEAEKILDGEVNGRRPPNDIEPARSAAKASLGDQSRLYVAHTDSGRYSGEILAVTNDHVVQKLSAQSAVAHPKHLLPSTPAPGQNLVIAYSHGQAAMKALEVKAKGKELGR